MAYRGGNIDFVIKGDTENSLDANDFKVLVYPNRHFDNALAIEKSAMQKVGTNEYSCTIDYKGTKSMSIGMYTIEVLFIENENHRSVFTMQSAFPLYESASEDIE